MKSTRWFAIGLLGLAVLCALSLEGCATSKPNQDVRGQAFPRVQGESLNGETIAIPDAFEGRPILLLVGYVQETQFDIDRWMLGVLQSGTDLPLREIPTIEGFVPGLISGTIDDGMREGIPAPDWGAVITVYDDASRILEFLGNERPRNARAVLLDAQGRVVQAHADGYSPRVLLEFLEAYRALEQGG